MDRIKTLAGIEREHIIRVLEITKGNKTAASKFLGIGLRGLRVRFARDEIIREMFNKINKELPENCCSLPFVTSEERDYGHNRNS